MADQGIHLANAYVSFSTNTRGLRREIDQAVGGASAGMDKRGRGMGSRLAAGIGRTLKVGAAAAATGAGVAMGASLVGGFRSAINQENIEKTLKGLYGSSKAAEDMMGRLRKVAGDSPIDYAAYGNGAQALAYMGVEGKQASQILENIGAAVTAAGGGGEEMGRATDALTKMTNAGKVQLDTLNQLSESGTPIFSGLADHFGTSISNVRDMVTEGKVGIEDVLAVTENASGDIFKQMKGASDEVSKSFGNQWKIAKDNVMVAIGQNMRPAIERLTPLIGKAGGALAGFINDFGAGEGAAGRFRGALGGLGGALRSGFGAALERIAPVVSSVFTAMEPHVRTFAGALRDLAPQAADLAKAIGSFLMDAFRAAQPYLKAFAQVVGAVLVGAMKALPPILSVVMSALTGMLNALKPLLPVVAAVAAAYGGYRLALLGISAAQKAAAIAAGAYRAVMFALHAPMAAWTAMKYSLAAAQRFYTMTVRGGTGAVRANTIAEKVGLILGKAKIAVTKAMAVAQRLLNAAMRANPIGLLITGLLLLGAGMVLAYKKSETFRRIVNAAWAGIKAAALAVVNWFRSTAWPWMKSVFTNIGNVAKWLWRNAIAPSFRLIKNIATSVFGWIKNTGWPWVRTALSAIGGAAKWLYTKWIKPYFGFIMSRAKSVFGWIKDTGWPLIRSAFGSIADRAKWLWGKVKWAFDKLKSGAGSVKDAIVRARDGIKSAWSKLNGYLRDPIKKALKWMNTHFIGNLNKMLGKLPGVDFKIPTLSVKGFAEGGYTGRGSKYQPAGIVHADEFVVSKKARNRFERDNPGALDHINRTGRMPGYYMGGKVSGLNPRFKKLLDEFNVAAGGRYSVYSGYRSNAHQQILYNRYLAGNGPVAARPGSSQHNKGLAADLAPSNARDVHGGLARRMGLVFTVPSESWHIEPSWGRGAAAMSGLSSGGGGGWGIDWVQSKIKGLTDKVKSLIGDFDPSKYGLAGKVLPPMFDKVRSAVTRKAKEGLSMFGGDGGDGSNISISKFANMGAREAVRGVANQYGWGRGANWSALDYIINRESSWNPNAANPTSSARGLFQKMTNIHGPVESTAAGQAKWGLNYIRGRYGNPVAARMFWNRNNWYDEGGRVTPAVFDNGGTLAPGLNLVNNKLGKPEPLVRPEHAALSGPITVNVIDRDGSFVERMRGEIAANDSHHNTRARMGVGRRG